MFLSALLRQSLRHVRASSFRRHRCGKNSVCMFSKWCSGWPAHLWVLLAEQTLLCTVLPSVRAWYESFSLAVCSHKL